MCACFMRAQERDGGRKERQKGGKRYFHPRARFICIRSHSPAEWTAREMSVIKAEWRQENGTFLFCFFMFFFLPRADGGIAAEHACPARLWFCFAACP